MTQTAPEAKPWFDEELDAPTSTVMTISGGQTPQVRLHAQITGYRYHKSLDAPVETFVLVDLSNTTASPGKLMSDANDKRGYFTDRVRVKVWLADSPEFVIRRQAPDSSSEGGSASTSTTYSISAGFFGDTGTASAGGSITYGSSQSLPDFEILNYTQTNDVLLDHDYQLRLISGATYRSPVDAVDTSVFGSIRHLNARAVSNLPLISSVLFHSATPVTGKRQLMVELTHRVVMVEKTFEVSVLGQKGYDRSRDDQHQISHVGSLKVETTPLIGTHQWTFDLDLDKGDVALHG